MQLNYNDLNFYFYYLSKYQIIYIFNIIIYILEVLPCQSTSFFIIKNLLK